MKTPKEFDYDLWTEEGRNMVRVKRTGEVCQVDDSAMRLLRAEEKRLRRSMQGAPVPGSGATEPVLSLDYMSVDENGDSASAWLEDPHDFTIAIATEALSKEFASTLTSREQEVYSFCLIQGYSQQAYAAKSDLSISRVSRLVSAVRKKAKNFLNEVASI